MMKQRKKAGYWMIRRYLRRTEVEKAREFLGKLKELYGEGEIEESRKVVEELEDMIKKI